MSEAGIALLAASLSAVISLVTLVIQIRTSKQQLILNAKLGNDNEVQKEKRDFIYRQLEDFYDPIYSLLSINQNVFRRMGPTSSTRLKNNFPESETAGVWQELSETVIVPNNLRIVGYIETKMHLMSSSDNVEFYLEFITHAQTYRVFKDKPYEAYKLFQFPTGFYELVEKQRNKLREDLDEMFDFVR